MRGVGFDFLKIWKSDLEISDLFLGLLRDAVISNVHVDTMAKVMRVKTAAGGIDKYFRGKISANSSTNSPTVDPLDFLVLFSSTSALFGQAGQASYGNLRNNYLIYRLFVPLRKLQPRRKKKKIGPNKVENLVSEKS